MITRETDLKKLRQLKNQNLIKVITGIRRGGKVYIGKHNDKEIDFVVQKPNNEREYYQVAYTVNNEKTFKREISAFRNIKDHYSKYLLTLDFDNTNIDGIQKLNVIDWLL